MLRHSATRKRIPMVINEVMAKFVRKREASAGRAPCLYAIKVAEDMEPTRAVLEHAVEARSVRAKAQADPLRLEDAFGLDARSGAVRSRNELGKLIDRGSARGGDGSAHEASGLSTFGSFPVAAHCLFDLGTNLSGAFAGRARKLLLDSC